MERENHDIVDYIKRIPSGYNRYNDDDDDDMLPAPSSSFGIKVADDFIVIDEVRTEHKKRNSPEYNKAMDEKLSRLEILNRHPDIKFLKLVAGALGGTLEDLFDTEELDRVHNAMNMEQSRLKRSSVEIDHLRKEIEAMHQSALTHQKEIAFMNSNTFNALKNALSQMRVAMEDYVQLARLEHDYDLIVIEEGDDVAEDDTRKKQLVQFLIQYYRDYDMDKEADTLERDVIKKEKIDAETLGKVALFALFIRDNMDLQRHSYDVEEGGRSLTESILHKGDRLKNTDVQESISDKVTRVKEENEEKDDDGNSGILHGIEYLDSEIIDKENGYPLVMYSNIYKSDKIVSAGIDLCDKSITSKKVALSSAKEPLLYKTWMLEVVKTLDLETDEADTRREALFSQLNKNVNFHTMHDDTLNGMLEEKKDDRGNAIDIEIFIDRAKSYFMWLYFTKTGILKVYIDNKDEIELHTEIVKQRLLRTKELLESVLELYNEVATTELVDNVFTPLRQQKTFSSLPFIDISSSSFSLSLEELVSDREPKEVIRQDSLVQYVQDGVKPSTLVTLEDAYILPPNVSEHGNNVLAWYKFFVDYVNYSLAFKEERERMITKKRHTIERLEEDVEHIHRERQKRVRYNSEEAAESPLVTGIIPLQPSVIKLIDNARIKVSRYCPALQKVKLHQMATKQAIDSGFTGEFTSLIAALDAYAALVRPRSYSPKHMVARVKEEIATLTIHLKDYTYSMGRGFSRKSKESTFFSYLQ